MGIIKAVTTAISGSLADQWLEVIESGNMGRSDSFYQRCENPQGIQYEGNGVYNIRLVLSSTCTPTSL